MDTPPAATLRADIPGLNEASSTSLTTPRATQVTMGAPLNTSLIQDADGFTILGGQFTSAAGDVTVHNHYPHPDLGLASISQLTILDDTFSESEIYSNQLLRQKRGFPLYVPGVQQNLPEEYCKRGVAIGDVGRITPDGSFDFFFNIYLPADHPINDNDVPENFCPLPPYKSKDLYDQSYLAGIHVSTPSVQRLDPDQDILPGSDFVFRCHSPQGAVLALPHGSHLQKLQNLDSVRAYAATHAESWFKYVNGPRGRGLDGSLYLVTGSEKTSSWGMASFHSVPETFQLTFMLPHGASGYRWRGNPAQRKYHDPSPMHEPYWNQTTFIHGLSISLGTGVWARMFETVQIREILNMESRLGGGGSNSISSSRGSSLFSRVLGLFGDGAAGGKDEPSRGHVVLSDLPPIPQLMHPGNLINNHILAKAPQANVVMSHDDDWCDILEDIQTVSDFLQRIDDLYEIVEKDGAAFLRASSGETQPVGAAVMLSGPTLRDHTIAPTKSQESHNSSLGRPSTGDEGSTSADTSTVRQTPSSGGGKDGGKTGEKEKENDRVLKRAHFVLPEIAVVYPISSLAPPSTPQLRDEKRAIEERERERRRRVVRANSSNSLNLVRSPSIGSVGESPIVVSGGGGGGGSSASGREDTASARTTSSGAKEKEKEGGEESEWWAMDKVESFYRECCEGCQEPPDMGIMAAFKNTPPTHPRAVDFSGVQFTFTSASILADVFSIEWGLRKAVFRECDLEELTLKPLLHALLIPRSLAYLSLAANRKLKGNAWKIVGAYVGKAHNLTFLDLSQNPLDKKAIECIVAALEECVLTSQTSTTSSPASFVSLSDTASVDSRDRDDSNSKFYGSSNSNGSDVRYGLGYGLNRDARDKDKDGRKHGLVSLKLDDCSLQAAALETLSGVVRTSSLRNISLRHNKISPTGAVAVALMIRDYPDVLTAPTPGLSSVPPSPTVASYWHGSPHSFEASHHPLPTKHATSNSAILPPRHPAAQQNQTLAAAQMAYKPYVPRSRPQSATLARSRYVPSPTNSVSSLDSLSPTKAGGAGLGLGVAGEKEREMREREAKERERERDGPSVALLDKVRALDALPRVGALRTLDLRGNDLQTGITYIAQVLKRNRTLKVLNLAENKLDVACLVSLAEALKYNSSLETLDLSRNPCSGPGLEGIQSLRTAFALNTALKQLFLSSTGMGSPGAIALAEFLPESASLLHLDLTENALGVAGVLALSKGLEVNFVMRCLDLNVPPGDEEFARMCRDILNSCVRNTEEAERRAGAGGSGSGVQTPVGNGHGHGHGSVPATGPGMMNGSTIGSGRGQGKGVWGMIEESELAKSIRLDEEKKIESDVVVRARSCIALLESMLAPPPIAPVSASPTTTTAVPPPSPAAALKQAEALTRELSTTIQATEDLGRMEELLNVNDELMTLIARAPLPGRPTLALQGLGLKWAPGATVASPAMENEDSIVRLGALPQGGDAAANGYVGLEEEELPTTPRIDKGKARAVPEPEEPEKMLSPTLILADDEDDEDGERFSPVEEREDDEETVIGESPTDRSRSWVEEEGEVFRKGTVLLGPEEMEGEYAGEDLRKELLEAIVERPPPRPVTDRFGIEILPPDVPPPPQDSPASPQPTSPAVNKPPPRPYVRRSSSASIMSTISPTISSFTSGGKIPEDQASPRIPSSPVPASPSQLGSGVQPHPPRSRSSS